MTREEIQETLGRMGLPLLDGVMTAADTWRRAHQQIDEVNFRADVRLEKQTAADDAGLTAATVALDRAIQADPELVALRLDRAAAAAEAGELRVTDDWAAASRAFPEVRSELIARVASTRFAAEVPGHVAVIGALTDAAAIVEHFADVELAGDERLTRTVGAVVLARLDALVSAGGPVAAAAQTHRAQLGARVNAWRRAHPSPAEKVRDIDRKLEHRAGRLRSSYDFVTKAVGLTPDGAARRRMSAVPTKPAA